MAAGRLAPEAQMQRCARHFGRSRSRTPLIRRTTTGVAADGGKEDIAVMRGRNGRKGRANIVDPVHRSGPLGAGAATMLNAAPFR